MFAASSVPNNFRCSVERYSDVNRVGDSAAHLEEQISRALRQHDITLAGVSAAKLAALRWGVDRDTTKPCSWNPNEHATYLTLPKLIHDFEQLDYLQRRGIADAETGALMAGLASLSAELAGNQPNGPVPFTEDHRARLGHLYNLLLHVRPTPRVAQALSPDWDAAKAEAAYIEGEAGIVILDGFLTAEALESLRGFCLESTIWSANRYNHGRLGAFLRDGFNCPLLLQIAEELRDALPHMIGRRYPLQQLWAFKTAERLPADSTTHADFAAVNVNFWITPTDANLDSDSGGMEIYDVQAPIDWQFDEYNGRLDHIHEYLKTKGAHKIRIPYRQNRAIIFNSDLFHATEAVRFRPGYENRRINVTMLYGSRHDDAHHLDSRRDHVSSLSRICSSSWRSAAFRR